MGAQVKRNWCSLSIPTPKSSSTKAAILASIGRMKALVIPTFRSCLLVVLLLLLGENAWGAASFFNVLDYGAHPDGSASSTEAIHSAIQAAGAAGGGRVYFPPGNYVTGPIDLVNNLVLDIDAGATLRFPATRLPFTRGREQGVECITPVPLIGGRNLQNVTITGRGMLTTDNAEWLKIMPRAKARRVGPRHRPSAPTGNACCKTLK